MRRWSQLGMCVALALAFVVISVIDAAAQPDAVARNIELFLGGPIIRSISYIMFVVSLIALVVSDGGVRGLIKTIFGISCLMFAAQLFLLIFRR